jgi:hypothetical protein
MLMMGMEDIHFIPRYYESNNENDFDASRPNPIIEK